MFFPQMQDSESWNDPWTPKEPQKYPQIEEYRIENTNDMGTLFAMPDLGESMIINGNSEKLDMQQYMKQLSDSTISSPSTMKEEIPDPEILVEQPSMEQEKISLLQQFRAITPRSSYSFQDKMAALQVHKTTIEIPKLRIKTAKEVQQDVDQYSKPNSGAKMHKIAAKKISEIFDDLLKAREALVLKADELELERVFELIGSNG